VPHACSGTQIIYLFESGQKSSLRFEPVPRCVLRPRQQLSLTSRLTHGPRILVEKLQLKRQCIELKLITRQLYPLNYCQGHAISRSKYDRLLVHVKTNKMMYHKAKLVILLKLKLDLQNENSFEEILPPGFHLHIVTRNSPNFSILGALLLKIYPFPPLTFKVTVKVIYFQGQNTKSE
jgi:hypothetical protein